MSKISVALQHPLHCCSGTWLQVPGKGEHEEQVGRPILDSGVGFDVEVGRYIKIEDEFHYLLLLSRGFSGGHVVPENICVNCYLYRSLPRPQSD